LSVVIAVWVWAGCLSGLVFRLPLSGFRLSARWVCPHPSVGLSVWVLSIGSGLSGLSGLPPVWAGCLGCLGQSVWAVRPSGLSGLKAVRLSGPVSIPTQYWVCLPVWAVCHNCQSSGLSARVSWACLGPSGRSGWAGVGCHWAMSVCHWAVIAGFNWVWAACLATVCHNCCHWLLSVFNNHCLGLGHCLELGLGCPLLGLGWAGLLGSAVCLSVACHPGCLSNSLGCLSTGSVTVSWAVWVHTRSCLSVHHWASTIARHNAWLPVRLGLSAVWPLGHNSQLSVCPLGQYCLGWLSGHHNQLPLGPVRQFQFSINWATIIRWLSAHWVCLAGLGCCLSGFAWPLSVCLSVLWVVWLSVV